VLFALQETLIHQSAQLQLQVYVFHQPLSTTVVQTHELHRFIDGGVVKLSKLLLQQTQSTGTVTDKTFVVLSFNKVELAKITRSILLVLLSI